MGNCCSSYKETSRDKINKLHLNELKICTFNTRLFQSVNHREKLDILMDFITRCDYNVICLQGINDVKLLRTIIKRIFRHNLEKNIKNRLSTYPMIETFHLNSYVNNFVSNGVDSTDVLKITWSNSGDDDMWGIDSLIITKENIISGSKMKMPTLQLREYDSYIYVANIEWNNTVISIYNVTLQADFIGISNEELRKKQIKELDKIIIDNSGNVMRENEYLELNKKNINVICCQSNIREFLNNQISKEYLYFTRTLNSLDTHRYVQTLKGRKINNELDATDISGTRSNYILLANLDTKKFDKVENIGEYLYQKNNLIIANSETQKLKLYEDFITSTTFFSKYFPKKEPSKEIIIDDIAIEII